MTDVAAEQKPVPKSRDGKIRWWDILIVFIGGNIVGTLLVILLGVAAILFIRRYHYSPISLSDASRNFPVTMVAAATNDLGILLVFWIVARRRFRPPFLHYFAPIRTAEVGWAAFAGLVLSAAIAGMNALIARLGFVKFKSSDFELAIIPHSLGQFLVAFAVVVLLVPFVEEILFRGMVLEWLRRVGGTWVAVILSAAFFSLAHFEFFFHQIPQASLYSASIFCIGVIMAIWVSRTNSLRVSYALHSAYNLVAILAGSLLSWHS